MIKLIKSSEATGTKLHHYSKDGVKYTVMVTPDGRMADLVTGLLISGDDQAEIERQVNAKTADM